MQKRIIKNLFWINFLILSVIFYTFKSAHSFDSSDNSIIQNVIFLKKEDRPQGQFNGKFITEIFDNYNYKEDGYNENYANNRLDLGLKIYNNFSAHSILKFEQIRPGTENNFGSNNRSFENEGGYAEELTLNYDQDNFSLLAGKFTLDFANGWKFQNGIWNNNLAKENYRFAGKIGAAALLKGGDQNSIGKYVLSLSSFANDRKYLSGSIVTKRDVASKEDLTPGDKGGFKSYNASLNVIFDFGNNEELTYHFSYVNLAVNDGQNSSITYKPGDQKGYAANMNYKYPYSPNLLFDGFIEYVKFDNMNGNKDKKANFLTTNLTLNLYQNWNLTLNKSREGLGQSGITGTVNKIIEFSGGYKFSEKSILKGLQIMLGWKQQKDEISNSSENKNAVGFLIRYVKLF